MRRAKLEEERFATLQRSKNAPAVRLPKVDFLNARLG